MKRQRVLFNIVTVHTSVDVQELHSSLTPVTTFSGLKKKIVRFLRIKKLPR